MDTIKKKIKGFYSRVLKKLRKDISPIEKLLNHINKVKVKSLVGYGTIIFVGWFLIGLNIGNFLNLLSDNYNISFHKEVELESKLASYQEAKILLEEKTDTSENKKEEETTSITKRIYYKLKKVFEERLASEISKIDNTKKESYITKINEILGKIDSLSTKSSPRFDEIIGKLTALREVIGESIEENEENLLVLESVPEKDETLKEEEKQEIIQEKKTEIKKEEVIVKQEKKKETVIINTPITEIKKEALLTPVVPTKTEQKEVVKVEVKKEEVKVNKPPLINTNKSNDDITIAINNQIESTLKTLNYSIYNEFKIKILKNDNLSLENGIRYTYAYTSFKWFGSGVKPINADLERSKINKDKSILLIDGNNVHFITDYTKVKLISDNIIENISNKKTFLKELAMEKLYLQDDNDADFLALKNETKNLTNGLSQASKIAKVYDYILRNISYTSGFTTADRKSNSWIYTYKRKVGVCGWYTKLALYMLSFAWVGDVSVVRGDVIDASDFPNIGHAWLRIWGLYYDPTFDDPVWLSRTKIASEYKYYALPRDLFYTNRFDYGTLPAYLKTETLVARQKLIQENLAKMAEKYKGTNYLLLKPFTFRNSYGLSYDENISLETLKNILPFYEVNEFSYVEENITKKITHIDYYKVDNNNIEILLEQLNYTVDGLVLFSWDNGEYRLSYKLATQ